ncbi:MAG: MFS transporter [Euzebyales bacterium]|nr:MFS transporter [Euzebyales bacterium]
MSTDDEAAVAEAGSGDPEGWRNPASVSIGVASFLADAGHEVPTALLPGFLTATLGAPAAALGLIEGIADGLAGGARLAGGALADDPVRRRRSAIGGYTATAVLSSAIGLAGSTVQVGMLRAGAWTARGLRVPARNALLADVVSPKQYGRAYGFERAMDNLGAIAGPVLALLLVTAVGVRGAMLISVVPGLMATGAMLYAIRRTTRPTQQRRSVRLRLKPLLATPLRRLAPGISLFEIGNVAATLLILRATELLEPGLGADRAITTALGLYIAYNTAATLVSIPAGRISDRRGSTLTLAAGVGSFAVAYSIMAATGASVAMLAVGFLAAGVGIGIAETAEHTAVATYSPEQVRGSAFGALAAVQAFGNVAASSIAGILWTAFGAPLAFTYAAALMITSAITLVVRRAPAA